MPGRVYPPAPVTAVGYGARGHKDSIPAYTAEVPNLVYAPNVGGASYDKEPALADVRAVLRTPSPTPSEVQVLASKTKLLGDWRRFLNWRRYANARSMSAYFPQTMRLGTVLTLFFRRPVISAVRR